MFQQSCVNVEHIVLNTYERENVNNVMEVLTRGVLLAQRRVNRNAWAILVVFQDQPFYLQYANRLKIKTVHALSPFSCDRSLNLYTVDINSKQLQPPFKINGHCHKTEVNTYKNPFM